MPNLLKNTFSSDVDEIMSKVPSWLVQWGTCIFGIVIIAFITLSFFIKYPDTIISDVTIYSENPPAHLIANVNGRIRNLFVINKQTVNKGQVLLELENSADYFSIQKLKNEIDTLKMFLKNFSPNYFSAIKNNQGLVLGEIQDNYSALSLKIDKYINFINIKTYETEIELLSNNLQNYRELYSQKRKQITLKTDEYSITYNKYCRDSLLFVKQLISEEEYGLTKKQRVNTLLDINNIEIEYLRVRIQLADLRKEIEGLKNKQKATKDALQSEIIAKYDNLLSKYNEWQLKYLLVSPIIGVISLSAFWSTNLNVRVGDVVVSILPKKESSIHGIVRIPLRGAGKIKKGNKVNIQLVNYPYQEFGLLSCKIYNIETVPSNGSYSAYIELGNKLITNYKKEIPFSHEMMGKAEIITEDRTLAERIFEPIKYFLKKNKH